MKHKTLVERVRRLEAIEAIGQVVGQYARGADRRNDPEIMGPLFLDDAVWEAEGFGRCEGRDAIVAHLARIGAEQIVWSLHYMVTPLVTLEENLMQARCRWYLWELAQFAGEGGQPASHWIGGWYDSVLSWSGEAWRFRHVILDLRLVHRHGENWSPLSR
ncbi:nuclear transport factor 2 family protein [Cupriavidus basilensis]|uniref:nuclear transport factor 2 family protein n=1 Tax=Cupriavidus basilensis TaxID=68895 RepID=UPI0039F72430